MDSAQDKVTGEIIEAEQLWLLDVVDKDGYVCRGCSIKVTPAAYRPENKVRPYFTARERDHEAGCDVDGEAKLIDRGRKERVSTPLEGFPAPYPSRLVLRDIRQIVGDPHGDGEGKGGAGGTLNRIGSGSGSPNLNRRRTAGTIRPLCRTFINFPYDRDLPLEVPGVKGDKYLSVFKKLKKDEIVRYEDSRLFYAPIRWQKPIDAEGYFEIMLDSGNRDENYRLFSPYRVRVEWETWSDAKRKYVRNEVEAARKEAIDAGNTGKKDKAWLFFIGTQDEDNKDLFHVTDHRLICCLVAEISYPNIG